MAGFRTALGRARGLGSAKHGVGHFIGQRVSAAALLLLTIWGVWSALTVVGGGYDGAGRWLESPVNAALLAGLVATGFYHGKLGLQTVIEDYFERPATKALLLVLNVFVAWGAGALAVVSILKVTLGGGAR